MSKHTPGPWSFHEKGKHPYPFVCAAPVATEYGEDSFVCAYIVGVNSVENGRLISTAPDLLEAAKDLAKQKCSTWGHEDEETGCCPSCRARAAVSKVEGLT